MNPPPTSGWLVTLGDLLALLLTFFILLFARSSPMQDSWTDLKGSFDRQFDSHLNLANTQDVNAKSAILKPATDLGYLAAVLRERLSLDPDVGNLAIEQSRTELRLVIKPSHMTVGPSLLSGQFGAALAGLAGALINTGNSIEIQCRTAAANEVALQRLRCAGDAGAIISAVGYRAPITGYGDDPPLASPGLILTLRFSSGDEMQ